MTYNFDESFNGYLIGMVSKPYLNTSKTSHMINHIDIIDDQKKHLPEILLFF